MRQYNRSFYYDTYGADGNPGYWGFWTIRAFGQILCWVFGMAFFGLVPHDKQLYSEAGSNTIYPYCLQARGSPRLPAALAARKAARCSQAGRLRAHVCA